MVASNSLPSVSDSRLFTPLKLGDITLSHRLIMAPLTRFRASDEHVHQPMAVEYYAQRAAVPGTLLITEATFISQRAGGFANVPGIYNAEQIAAWKKVTDAVHAKGSFIYCQLWALGRVATVKVTEAEGIDIVAPSALRFDDGSSPGGGDYATPREMTDEDIEGYVSDYTSAAKNAIEAGFDGVEVHGANGYLIDQFIQTSTNHRTDKWGGSVENRSRFAHRVVESVVQAVGGAKVGIRLSPYSSFQGMGQMEDPVGQFTDVIKRLKPLDLAYIHVVESRISGNADVEETKKIDFAIDVWGAGVDSKSPVLIAGGFKPDSARRAVDDEYKNKDIAVVFGRYFLSTPDLPYRIQHGLDLNAYDRNTFYVAKSEKGYTDYPYSKEFEKSAL